MLLSFGEGACEVIYIPKVPRSRIPGREPCFPHKTGLDHFNLFMEYQLPPWRRGFFQQLTGNPLPAAAGAAPLGARQKSIPPARLRT